MFVANECEGVKMQTGHGTVQIILLHCLELVLFLNLFVLIFLLIENM